MRKLVIWNLMSLDGFFEGETPWDLSFHRYAWGPELHALSQHWGHEGDLLIFGRKTYEGMAAYWSGSTDEDAVTLYMNAMEKIAVSRSLTRADWNNSRIVRDPVAEIGALKAAPGKTMFVFGSAELTASLLEAGLVDEYRICIVPVLLGRGNPLFKPAPRQRELTLTDTQVAANGAVILRYAVGA